MQADTETDQFRLARYYGWLTQFQRARWLGRASGSDALTVHRRLAPAQAGVVAQDGVHERLLAALGPMTAPRAIDAGSGFGGTIFFLHGHLGGVYDGLTLSAAQRARAAREAERRAVAGSCRFHVRSYDQDLSDLAPDGIDLVVAIESLAHAVDPARSVGNFSRVLASGGVLAIVDDFPALALADDDPDFVAFREGWCCPAIARRPLLVAAMEAAGLSIERDGDWSPSVVLRDADALERLVRVNRRWRRVLAATPARVLIDALHGGLMLERLYRRGLMQYRLLLARRSVVRP